MATCFRLAASDISCVYFARKCSMCSRRSISLDWSFRILAAVLWSSSRSQASTFACFSCSCSARRAVLALRYSIFLCSLASASVLTFSIMRSRSWRYSCSECFRFSCRSAILSSRLVLRAASASFLAVILATLASTSALARTLASSNFFFISSSRALAVSMSSRTAFKSRSERSCSLAAIFSALFLSNSAYRFCRSSLILFSIAAFAARSALSSSIRCLLAAAFSSSSFFFSCNSATKALRFFSRFNAMLAFRFSWSFSASARSFVRSAYVRRSFGTIFRAGFDDSSSCVGSLASTTRFAPSLLSMAKSILSTAQSYLSSLLAGFASSGWALKSPSKSCFVKFSS
mmetsp:Transcript_69714/g.167357  ORF Transcript_69714/g.167357 Transcript_69714/m.167357 type:complete len:345 (-) Transcript_69714:221-1255(-)